MPFIAFSLNFVCTMLSQNIITATPNIIPKVTFIIFDISIASGIKSKQTIASINPDANANMKLKNLFVVFLKHTPIIPPIVVPNVPKNNPISVVFSKSSNFISSYNILYLFFNIIRTFFN